MSQKSIHYRRIRCRDENKQTLESGIVHRVRDTCNTKSPTITVSLSA